MVDAAGKVLGRLAAEIARRLRGKHKPEFTPHIDTGDYIVVVNVDKLRVTGRKAENKIYYRHSGYPGRHLQHQLRQAACAAPRPGAEARGEGHAAQGTARLRDAQEDEDLRRREPSAHGAATQEPGDLTVMAMQSQQQNYGTGRRKSAVARVYLRPGKGTITVNGRPVDEFFSRETGRMIVRQPLALTNTLTSFDISVNVDGGGESGQAGAVRHGITRALIEHDAGAQDGAQEGGARDARRARGRAQEGRAAQGPPTPPVLQAISPGATSQPEPPAGGFGRLWTRCSLQGISSREHGVEQRISRSASSAAPVTRASNCCGCSRSIRTASSRPSPRARKPGRAWPISFPTCAGASR